MENSLTTGSEHVVEFFLNSLCRLQSSKTHLVCGRTEDLLWDREQLSIPNIWGMFPGLLLNLKGTFKAVLDGNRLQTAWSNVLSVVVPFKIHIEWNPGVVCCRVLWSAVTIMQVALLHTNLGFWRLFSKEYRIVSYESVLGRSSLASALKKMNEYFEL